MNESLYYRVIPGSVHKFTVLPPVTRDYKLILTSQ